ncbi:MAG: O-antigen ligase family protein [Pseudomonadota bacterium]
MNASHRVAGWAVLLGIGLATLALGANRPPAWIALTGLCLGVASLLWLAGRQTALPPRGAALAFAAVVLWCVLQTLPVFPPPISHPLWTLVERSPAPISADPLAGLLGAVRLMGYGLAFWIIWQAAADRAWRRAAVSAMALALAALSAFGLWAWIRGSNPILTTGASDVVTATFLNRNAFATAAGIGVVANLTLFRLSQARRSKMMYAGALTTCVAALAFSESRGGVLATVIAVAGVLAVLGHWRWAVTGALAVAAALAALSPGLIDRTTGLGIDSARIEIYLHILTALGERPILGHGLGGFEASFSHHIPAELAFGEWRKAHNTYLETVYELGLPAAFLFLAAMGACLIPAIKAMNPKEPAAVAALGATVLFGTHGLFDFSVQVPANAYLFLTCLALGVGASRQSADKSTLETYSLRGVPHSDRNKA